MYAEGLWEECRYGTTRSLTSSLDACELSESLTGCFAPGEKAPGTEKEVAWDPLTVWTIWIREKSDDPLEVQPVAKIRQYNKVLVPAVLNSPIGFREKR